MKKNKAPRVFPFGRNTTVSDAREWVYNNLVEGCICPCCNQYAKDYKRRILKKSVISAFNLAKLQLNNDNFYHLDEFKHDGDTCFAYLKWWNLIEEKPTCQNSKKKSDGYYRLTPSGFKWLSARSALTEHVHLYNNEVLGHTGNYISIRDSLKEYFDYDKLMEESGIQTD